MIKELELINFRNYAATAVEFGERGAVFTGANGSGKTNILEAIFFMTMLRSFRTVTPREMIRHGKGAFRLRGRLARGIWQEALELTYAGNGERELMRNSQKIRKSSAYIGRALPVAFIPEDINLVSGSASLRRRFVDMYLSMLNADYQRMLFAYNTALVQRNAALKRGHAGRNAAAAFEPILAESGVYITRQRRVYAAQLATEVGKLLADEPGLVFTLAYTPSAPFDDINDYRRQLDSDRTREIARGVTLCGPHLDDFVFALNGKPMRSFASTGQRRKLAIYLKLAAYEVIRQQLGTRKIPLLVLVDDVTGELDEHNKKRFFNSIREADQSFFTFSAADTTPALEQYGRFQVEQGKITPA